MEHLRGSHGIIFVYDVTNPESFESLSSNKIDEIMKVVPKGMKTMLVGNKVDWERKVDREVIIFLLRLEKL